MEKLNSLLKSAFLILTVGFLA